MFANLEGYVLLIWYVVISGRGVFLYYNIRSVEMTKILSGVTPETYKEMQKGPGVIIRNFDYRGIADAEQFGAAVDGAIARRETLGATRGGIGISITPKFRRRGADGVISRMAGDSVIVGWECYMTATLLEFNPVTLGAVFPSGSVFSGGAAFSSGSVFPSGAAFPSGAVFPSGEASGVENYTFVGTTEYGWIMVAFHNGLGQLVGGICTESDGEGGIPFRVDGFVSEGALFEDGGLERAPVDIWVVDRGA